jgi:hypothetical protein
MTTYIYVKEAKSQVMGENGAINAKKGLFINLDTWGNRTSLREFRMKNFVIGASACGLIAITVVRTF